MLSTPDHCTGPGGAGAGHRCSPGLPVLGPRLTQAFSAGMGLWAERPPLAADRTHLQKGLRGCAPGAQPDSQPARGRACGWEPGAVGGAGGGLWVGGSVCLAPILVCGPRARGSRDGSLLAGQTGSAQQSSLSQHQHKHLCSCAAAAAAAWALWAARTNQVAGLSRMDRTGRGSPTVSGDFPWQETFPRALGARGLWASPARPRRRWHPRRGRRRRRLAQGPRSPIQKDCPEVAAQTPARGPAATASPPAVPLGQAPSPPRLPQLPRSQPLPWVPCSAPPPPHHLLLLPLPSSAPPSLSSRAGDMTWAQEPASLLWMMVPLPSKGSLLLRARLRLS